ncbi:SDR family NAD(P)-dependent oxidoreductase [Streptomyces mirabilis]|uniref:SDR family NAD(P)-dependent oxidoreductase n=1 Tax=Streptomyces mirabilis TaxID=68239 RepID=UPI0036F12013
MSTSRKVVLATGASSGIGPASAELLAERGHHVVLGSRRTERLKEITEDIHAAGGSAEYHATGVTESELAESISDPEGRERMRTYRSVAIPASSVAAAIAFAMDQPAGVDVGEIIVRPTAGRT